MIVQRGIIALQQKLAAVLQELTGVEEGARGDEYEPRSPGMNGAGGAMNGGYTTPYDNQGSNSVWESQTPFAGATPYGSSTTPWGGS